MHLRAYAAGDLDRLHALDQACFPLGIAYSKAELQHFIHSPSAFTAVAVEGDPATGDERILGFAVVRNIRVRTRPTLHIITIDVDPQVRRHRVGSLLMRWMEERAAALGSRALRLEVAVDNMDAQRFYEHHGFSIVSRIPGYYGTRLDAFVMERATISQSDVTGQ